MPIRIRPNKDLRPCILTLDSIVRITERIERDFQGVEYSASDDIWEIFDEQRQPLLDAISQRDTLDSFVIKAKLGSGIDFREIEITFNENEASVKLVAAPQYIDWFEHLLVDIKKYILPPSFNQLTTWGARIYSLSPLFAVMPFGSSVDTIMSMRNAPYCRIILRQKPPNPLLENIKANIISNILWVILVFVLGFVASRLFGG